MQKINTSDPIHEWFGLSYSNYLVMPRSVLQSMPQEWQQQFVGLIEQIPEVLDLPCEMPDYIVLTKPRKNDSDYNHDFYSDYMRGRREFGLKEVPDANQTR